MAASTSSTAAAASRRAGADAGAGGASKRGILARPLVALGALAAATALSYAIGLAAGGRWLLPVLNTAPAYLLMAALLRRGEKTRAVVAMLVWAACLAVFGTVGFATAPTAPDALVVHGPEYRDEMFHWIRTGEGSESRPREFLPQHVLHLAAFVGLCLATASAAGILMGAVLMNYMSFYVASLARAGLPTATVILFGWQPWAIVRVAGFCILGAVLAEPLLARVAPYRTEGVRGSRRWLLVAVACIVGDWVLKAALAPIWQRTLHGLLP